jgi:cytoskeletal protein RodZ
MNVNPDPRPGRWLLPLVVLGMVMFTYVFVNQLPGDGAPPTTAPDDSASPTSSTSLPDGSDPSATTVPGDTTEPTTAPPAPEAAAYLEAMQAFNTQLTGLQADLSAANAAWEAGGPGSYSAAQAAFTEINNQVAEWRDQVVAVSVPEGLSQTHENLVTAAEAAATQVAAALDGLVNAPGPEPRVQAVARFDEAVSAFGQALSEAGG